MKINIILILVFLLNACTEYQTKTGQRFSKNNPEFYLSIAPSFSAPYEYEVVSNSLVLRKYSGLGGYNWGTSKLQAKKALTLDQSQKIRALALVAAKESILEEELATQTGNEVVVMDGTRWYLLTDGVGSFVSISINSPSNNFYELEKYLESLLQ